MFQTHPWNCMWFPRKYHQKGLYRKCSASLCLTKVLGIDSATAKRCQHVVRIAHQRDLKLGLRTKPSQNKKLTARSCGHVVSHYWNRPTERSMKKISRCMTRQQFSQHFLSNKLEQKYEQSTCLEQRHEQLVTQLWGSSLHISP